MIAQKLADLLFTEEPDCVTQAGELMHALGEPWRPEFLRHHKLHNLRGKVLAIEDFILVHDKELCFFLIPARYSPTGNYRTLQHTPLYYFMNNSKSKYGNGKIGGPQSLLSTLSGLDRVITMCQD